MTSFSNDQIGTSFEQLGLVALMSKADRFKSVYCWANQLNLGNLPLDISKFDNNVQLWMMSDICWILGLLCPVFRKKCESVA